MTTISKSAVRHLLTAIGTLVALVGLNELLPVISFLQTSLDTVWEAVVIIIGFITALIGFFKDSERFKATNDAP